MSEDEQWIVDNGRLCFVACRQLAHYFSALLRVFACDSFQHDLDMVGTVM